jgi:hypothetical protein
MWDKFVDTITVIWLGMFFVDLMGPSTRVSDIILLSMLPIYVFDLGVKYRRAENAKDFFQHHWLSVLMVIPYIRILRAARMLRVLRMIRFTRTVRVGRNPGGLKLLGASRRIKRLRRRISIWNPRTS